MNPCQQDVEDGEVENIENAEMEEDAENTEYADVDDAESTGHTEHVNVDEAAHPKEVSSPDDLHHLIKHSTVSLHAWHSYNGTCYSRSSTHVGNSLIYYHPGGDQRLALIPGSIKYIYLS
jgi:hypothetical protein